MACQTHISSSFCRAPGGKFSTPQEPFFISRILNTIISRTEKLNREKQKTNRLDISVKDNGLGIPQKVLDKIYQPFFTTKPTGQGTGLGLSLSYDIITKGHGGELRVVTEEGNFAEFVIQLPYSSN